MLTGTQIDPTFEICKTPPSLARKGLSEADEQGPVRLLMVDDDPLNAMVFESLLETIPGVTAHSTTDSREAMKLYRELDPDLIILDMNMPHMSGIDILREIRSEQPANTFLPILVLTGDQSKAAKLRALSEGATDFLPKTDGQTEIVPRIKNLLHTRKLQQEVAKAKSGLEREVRKRTAELERALTDLRCAEHHLVQRERLSALGTMASGVAHDFKNTLSLVLGYGELLGEGMEALPLAKRTEFLHIMMSAAQDAVTLTDRLRVFSNPSSRSDYHEKIDLAELVREVITLTEPKWKYQARNRGATITMIPETHQVSSIVGNAAELREMMTNLIFNAVDAIPSVGAITIRTWGIRETVVLEVSDTGEGMPEEVRRRCLEPFFTTKGENGTGLGLAMVYGIVQRHEAELAIESAPGQGTTFRIQFPAARGAATPHGPAAAKAMPPLSVLVVDDNPEIGSLLSQYLAGDGHHSVSVSNPLEALERMAVEHFDLLITGQAMPQVCGRVLAKRAKALSPTVRVILHSAAEEEETLPADSGIDRILKKPAKLADIRNAIADAFKSPDFQWQELVARQRED